jgi:hypothetical protein
MPDASTNVNACGTLDACLAYRVATFRWCRFAARLGLQRRLPDRMLNGWRMY